MLAVASRQEEEAVKFQSSQAQKWSFHCSSKLCDQLDTCSFLRSEGDRGSKVRHLQLPELLLKFPCEGPHSNEYMSDDLGWRL